MEEPRKRHHKKKTKRKPLSDDQSVVSKDTVFTVDEERRRLKQLQRRARKAKEHLAELGLDEDGNPLDNYSILKYPVREWKVTIPGSVETLALNPVVTFISICLIWGIVVWSTVDPEGSLATLIQGRSYVTLTYTWLFQGSKAFFFFFMVYITYRYGHIHFGRKDEAPEFTFRSWLAMIFSGTGPALLVASVSEPLMHQSSNYFAKAGYNTQDENDLHALLITLSNWSITTWLLFTVVAVATSLSYHNFGLPLSFRSCYYPIFGAYTWGWMGDCIDALAIVVMILSICVMMCQATIQIVTGLMFMGWVDAESTSNEIIMMQKTTVWVVTFISTASVVSGLAFGIQYMCLLAASLGFFLLLLIFVMDDMKYLLNLQIQELGYFLQHGLVQLNFWTDAMGQLREGSGRAVDGRSAEQWWMSSWIVFYQAWVVALSTVFGVFVARISRGRKLWEVVFGCFVAPSLSLLVWFCVFGGIGMRQARQGMELEALGDKYFNNSQHFLVDGSEVCYDVPQHDVVVGDAVVFTNYLPGVTPVCKFREEEAGSAVFNVLYSFKFPDSFGGDGLGPALSVLYLICCAIFYVTLSDSSSLIVDNIASNGRKNNHWARRMFWASSVGALTTTLLSSGSGGALKAVEAAVIVGALPAAFLVCLLFQSITLFCRQADHNHEEVDYEFPDQPEFTMPVYGGILNVMEYIMSLGRVNEARVDRAMHQPSREQLLEFVKGILVPYVTLHQVLTMSYPQNPQTNKVTVLFYATCYLCWTSLWLASWARPGLTGMCLSMFVVTGMTLGIVRAGFRAHHNIRSNYFADWFVGLFLWPQVVAQMRLYQLCPEAAVTVQIKHIKMDTMKEEDSGDSEPTKHTKMDTLKERDGGNDSDEESI